MNNRKKADALDIRVKKELATMLQEGYTFAPISRPALQSSSRWLVLTPTEKRNEMVL